MFYGCPLSKGSPADAVEGLVELAGVAVALHERRERDARGPHALDDHLLVPGKETIPNIGLRSLIYHAKFGK